ncbi:uncharacterized protein LOC127243535 isoform X2 [Andrographis paniculata]|uniref:uncharacterized protein LOC127243535 isoform X2 n=1 Tax=Andrographis paniculata TaxID=175694 RepID=UPI0021E71215|nr:uncharacterized protein LOC127243535 isoform X2 [Andrographis paniculata]
MQRQSLGSPVKDDELLQFHGGEEDHKKKEKAITAPQTAVYLHIIPFLTLFCFLILYLSSHHPSQYDMAQFSGFRTTISGSTDSEHSSALNNVKIGDILAVRSLKHSAAAKLRRRHRKMVMLLHNYSMLYNS